MNLLNCNTDKDTFILRSFILLHNQIPYQNNGHHKNPNAWFPQKNYSHLWD